MYVYIYNKICYKYLLYIVHVKYMKIRNISCVCMCVYVLNVTFATRAIPTLRWSCSSGNLRPATRSWCSGFKIEENEMSRMSSNNTRANEKGKDEQMRNISRSRVTAKEEKKNAVHSGGRNRFDPEAKC